MHKALVFENFEQNHSTLAIVNQDVVSISLLKKFIIFLTEKGELWRSGEFPETDGFNNFDLRRINDLFSSKPTRILELSINKIIAVSCNNYAIHAVSAEGYLFSWGLDSDNTGILGLGDVKSQRTPSIVEKLKSKKIKYIHTGNKHASAIDSSGHLYLWGTGFQGEIGVNGKARYSRPHMINIPDVLNCKKSFCNKTSTFMITFGGKLYMLGSLKKGERNETSSISNVSDTSKKHSQIQEIKFSKSTYLQDVVSGEGFAVALTSQGELFQINYGLDISKMLVSGEFNSIGVNSQKLYAINGENDMYEWDFSFFTNSFDMLSPTAKKSSGPKIMKVPNWVGKPRIQTQLFSRSSLIIYHDSSDMSATSPPNFSSLSSNNRQSLLQDHLSDPFGTYRRQSDNENYSEKVPGKGRIKDAFFNLNLASPTSISIVQSPAVNDSMNPKRKGVMNMLDSVHYVDTGRPSLIAKELNTLKQKLDWRGNNSNINTSSLAFNETLKQTKNVSKFFDSNANLNSPVQENQFFEGFLSQNKRNKSLEDSMHYSSGKMQRDSSLKREERKQRNKQKIEEISKQLKAKLMTQNLKENVKTKSSLDNRKKEFTRDLLKISPAKKGFGSSQIRLFSEENSFSLNDDFSSNFSQNAQSEIPRRDNSNNTTAFSNFNLTSNTPNLRNKDKASDNTNHRKMIEEEFDRSRTNKREKRNFNIDIMSIGVEKKAEKPGKSLEYFIGLIKSENNNNDYNGSSQWPENDKPVRHKQDEDLTLIQETSEANSSFLQRKNVHAAKSSFLPVNPQASGNSSVSRSNPHTRNKSMTPYDQSLQSSNHTRTQFSPVFYNNAGSFADNLERLPTNSNRAPSISSFERLNTFGGVNRSLERASVADSLRSRETMTIDLDKMFEKRALERDLPKSNTSKRAESIMNQYKKVLKGSEAEERQGQIESKRSKSTFARKEEPFRESRNQLQVEGANIYPRDSGSQYSKERAHGSQMLNNTHNISNQNISRSDSYSMFCQEDGIMTREELQDDRNYRDRREMMVFETFRNEDGVSGECLKLDVKQEKSILVGERADAKQVNRRLERGFTFAGRKGTNEPAGHSLLPTTEDFVQIPSNYQRNHNKGTEVEPAPETEELHELSFRNEKESELIAKKIVKRAFDNVKILSDRKNNMNIDAKPEELVTGNSHIKDDLKSMYSPTKEIHLGTENIENAVKNLMSSFDNISDLKAPRSNTIAQVSLVNAQLLNANSLRGTLRLLENEEASYDKDDSFTRCIMQLTEKIPDLSKQEFKRLTREIMDRIFPKRTPTDLQEEENLIQHFIDNITRSFNNRQDEVAAPAVSKGSPERYEIYREKKNITSPTAKLNERSSPLRSASKEEVRRPLAQEERSNSKKANTLIPHSDEKKAKFDQMIHNDLPLQMKSFSMSEHSHSNISLCKITPIRPRPDSQRLERFVMMLALVFERNRMKRFSELFVALSRIQTARKLVTSQLSCFQFIGLLIKKHNKSILAFAFSNLTKNLEREKGLARANRLKQLALCLRSLETSLSGLEVMRRKVCLAKFRGNSRRLEGKKKKANALRLFALRLPAIFKERKLAAWGLIKQRSNFVFNSRKRAVIALSRSFEKIVLQLGFQFFSLLRRNQQASELRTKNIIGLFIASSQKSAVNRPLTHCLLRFSKNAKRLKCFMKISQRISNMLTARSPHNFIAFAFKTVIAFGSHKRDQAERMAQQQSLSKLENNFEQLKHMQRLMQERSEELQRKEQELLRQRETDMKRLRDEEELKMKAREDEFQRQRESDQRRQREDAARRELEEEHRRQRESELKEQLELLKKQKEEEARLRKEKEEELERLQKEEQRRRLNIDEKEIGALLSRAVQSSIGLLTQELGSSKGQNNEKIEDFELLHAKPKSATLRKEDLKSHALSPESASSSHANPLFKTMPASLFKLAQEESLGVRGKEIEIMNEEMKEKISKLTVGEIMNPEEEDGGVRDSQSFPYNERRKSDRKDQQRKNLSQKKYEGNVNDRYAVSLTVPELKAKHSKKASQDSKGGANKKDINIYREARKRRGRVPSNANDDEGMNANSMNDLSQVLPYKSKSVNNSGDSELFCEELSQNSSFCKEISKIDFFGKKPAQNLQRKIDFQEHVELALEKSLSGSGNKNENAKRARSLSGEKKGHCARYLKSSRTPACEEEALCVKKKYNTLTVKSMEREQTTYSKTLNNEFYTDIREVSENNTPIRRNQIEENVDGINMGLAEPIELETSPRVSQAGYHKQQKKEQPSSYVDIYKQRSEYMTHSRNSSNEMKSKQTQRNNDPRAMKNGPLKENNQAQQSTRDSKTNKHGRQIGINTREEPEIPNELRSKRDESAPAKLGIKCKPGEIMFKQNFSPIKKSPSTVFDANTFRTELDDLKSMRSKEQEAANFENYLSNFNKQKYSKTIDFNFERHLKENSPGKAKGLEESRTSTRNKHHPVGALSFSQSQYMNKSMVGKKSPSFNSSFCSKGSNMQKVIENQKKFIGDSFKTLHGASTGRLLSPTYQEYLARGKAHSMASLSPERNAVSKSPARK